MDELRAICARFPLNELVSAECKHLTGSLPDSEGVADQCTSLDGVERSAYIGLGVRCLAEGGSLSELVERVQALRLTVDRFKIEVQQLFIDPALSKRDAVFRLADAIHGGPDLREPQHRFVFVGQKKRLWFGEIITSCERDYRQHEAKPYHTTNSLPARLARGLVNLVVPPARTILDPFCGTGSILLEAKALGLDSYGVDISKKLFHIARANLAHFGYPTHVEWGNALKCQHRVDAIVTDMPYGRTIDEINREEISKILNHLVELAPQGVYMAGEPISDLLAQAGYTNVEIYCVRKRIGMQRYVHHADNQEIYQL